MALYVSSSGGKSWHFRFTLNGKRQRISLEVYSEVGLAEARVRCESNHLLVKQGISPGSLSISGSSLSSNALDIDERYLLGVSEQEIIDEVSSSVESFAEFSVRWLLFKWLDKRDKRQSTAVQIERYLRKDMLPVLGHYRWIGLVRRMCLEYYGVLRLGVCCRLRRSVAVGCLACMTNVDVLCLPALRPIISRLLISTMTHW